MFDLEMASFVLDVALGLLALGPVCPDGLGVDEVEAWEAAAAQAEARGRVAWLDDDVETTAAAAVEAELWRGLADTLPARDVLVRCCEVVRTIDRGAWAVSSDWACPDCSDDLMGAWCRLSYLGGGRFVCPVCGCETTSPADDACVRLDDETVGGR